MLSNEKIFLNIIKEGSTSISNLLLANYSKIGLLDHEAILVIHLLYFQSKGNNFPSITELERRMILNTEEIMKLLQRLVKQGYIYIEETIDKESGKIVESYNLTPIFIMILKEEERSHEIKEIERITSTNQDKINNIFKVFEMEFGRPLSPMEIELINTWIDNDKYSDELIIHALKEAVFTNKLNFRYIDKILFEWQKKNIKTVEQAKENSKKFRNNNENRDTKPFKGNNNFELYNWLEND